MNARLYLVLSLLLALLLVAGSGLSAAPPPAPDQAQVAASSHTAPLMFIQNVGQFDPRARFQVHGGTGGALWLADDALWLTLLKPASPNPLLLHGGQGERASPPLPLGGEGPGVRVSISGCASWGPTPSPGWSPSGGWRHMCPTSWATTQPNGMRMCPCGAGCAMWGCIRGWTWS